ncbi:MAG: hypothetical protein OEW77_04965 [Gemmatimonadota bacterium]|nr:hypothetical protein [Gemmatimonadota bacterium]
MTQRRSFPFPRAAGVAGLLLAAACAGDRTGYVGPYQSEVRRAIPEIEESSGLTFKTPPKLEERTRDEVRAFLEKQFNEQLSPLELSGTQEAYRLLGMLPDTLDLRAFLLDLLTEQVAGYYDPATKVLYVVKDAPADIRGITISHELVHALQDQYVRLDSVQSLKGDNDRQVAMQAVVEGQAVYEQMATMLGGADFGMQLPGGWDRVRDMIRSSQASMPLFANAPTLLQETLLFPYLSGAEFNRQFKRARPDAHPWAPFASSTEQVLHPERYLDSVPDLPTTVTLGAPRTGSLVYEQNLGEFEARLFLFEHLKDAGLASRAAEGWDGDRYQVVNTPRGAGIAWVTVWDSAVEAAEFRDAMEQLIGRRFKVAANTGGSSALRRWTAAGRHLLLSAETIDGRPVVVYEDLPATITQRVLAVDKVRLEGGR